MYKIKVIIFTVSLVWMFFASGLVFSEEEFVVIVNKNTSVTFLSSEDVKKIFLSRIKYSPDALEWMVVDFPDDDIIKHNFYEKTTGKNHKRLRAYRIKKSFSGKFRWPKILLDSRQIKEYVKANENAIAYIHRSKLDDSVRAVYKFLLM